LKQCLNLISTQIDVDAGLHVSLACKTHQPPKREARRDCRTNERKGIRNNFRNNEVDIRTQAGSQIRCSLKGLPRVLKIGEDNGDMKFRTGFAVRWGEYLVCGNEC